MGIQFGWRYRKFPKTGNESKFNSENLKILIRLVPDIQDTRRFWLNVGTYVWGKKFWLPGTEKIPGLFPAPFAGRGLAGNFQNWGHTDEIRFLLPEPMVFSFLQQRAKCRQNCIPWRHECSILYPGSILRLPALRRYGLPTVENDGFQSWMIFQSLQKIIGKAESDLTLKLEGGTIFRDLKLVGWSMKPVHFFGEQLTLRSSQGWQYQAPPED